MIRKFLDCSSGHLSPDTWTWLDAQLADDILRDPGNTVAAGIAGGRTRYGWFLYASTETCIDMPTDLRRVCNLARRRGAEWRPVSTATHRRTSSCRCCTRTSSIPRPCARRPAIPTTDNGPAPRHGDALHQPLDHAAVVISHHRNQRAARMEEHVAMLDNPRLFRRTDPDFPTTRAVQERLVVAGRVEGEGPLASGRNAGQRCRLCGCSIDSDPEADRTIPACGSCKARPDAHERKAPAARGFTEADRSLIRKIHGYMPRTQLLGILNDRLRSDLGPDAKPYSIEQLHAEIAALPGAKPGGDHGWAGLRKLLAHAKQTGTLDQIDEQVINDFAVVFSLSPKHLMRLKDVLLQPEEE